MDNKCILIVDDDQNIASSLKRSLIDEDYEIVYAQSGEEGLQKLAAYNIQLIISDESMPGMTGTELLSMVKDKYPDIVRIMLTGKASIESAMKAVNQGEIFRFFTKPWDDVELKLSIRHGLERYEYEEERRRLLSTIKVQSDELTRLEKQFPGITDIKEDETGAIVLPELSQEELESVRQWCRTKDNP